MTAARIAALVAMLVAGAVLAIVGFIGLSRDVSITATDQQSCGNGFSADYTAVDSQSASYAYAGIQGFNLRDECDDARSAVRSWAWPVSGSGVLLVVAAALAWALGTRSRRVGKPVVGSGSETEQPHTTT